MGQLPKDQYREVAFLGRSNVGKSSLINKLVNRKSLARSSSMPGKTRELNYYIINKQYYFVDLPGYGYAKVSKQEHSRWQHMIEDYILSNPLIKRIIWLRDVRRDFDSLDEMFLDWVHVNNLPVSLVLTKIDKATQGEIAGAKAALQQGRGIDGILVFSSKNGLGKSTLASHIIQSL